MASNGIIIINIAFYRNTNKLVKLDVNSEGFLFMKETKRLLSDARANAQATFDRYLERNKKELNLANLEIDLRTSTYRLMSDKIERRPMVKVNFIEL
jgi:hypothetical protein